MTLDYTELGKLAQIQQFWLFLRDYSNHKLAHNFHNNQQIKNYFQVPSTLKYTVAEAQELETQ